MTDPPLATSVHVDPSAGENVNRTVESSAGARRTYHAVQTAAVIARTASAADTIRPSFIWRWRWAMGGVSRSIIHFSSNRQVARSLPTILGIFGQAARDNTVQLGRRERLERGNWWRISVEDRAEQGRGRRPFEGPPPGRIS